MRFLLLLFIFPFLVCSQGKLKGVVLNNNGNPLEFVNVFFQGLNIGASTNQNGGFLIESIPNGKHKVLFTSVGFEKIIKEVKVISSTVFIEITMIETDASLSEFVVSGTMKSVSKLDSPVPVEVYSDKFFKANPTPSVFESMQNVNGVRPQLNCNVCNTGDIHINGLEGPYTMVLIDGMPIVSGLSTVYGLTGIPQALIERIEIVKGPASTLYGSEAVGGLINIITKTPSSAPIVSVDMFVTSWAELNTDVGLKFKAGEKANSILGISYFNYSNPIDNNKDGFTDVTLQDRISLFNKWSFKRKENRVFSIAARYLYEDRWGGDMNWNSLFRGGDSIYAESIYTNRWETFGVYQLPIKETVNFYFSANGHSQNSVYGDLPYIADQYIGFSQLTWNKVLNKKHDILSGIAYRYIYYDDNTPATASFDSVLNKNKPSVTHLPGVFIQDEITFNQKNKLLVGIRYDLNSIHGNIFSPRLNYKWNSVDKKNILRLSVGNGYRVANVFTEDHAALTGARKIEFIDELNPETSWNGNINYVKKIIIGEKAYIGLDGTAFYTYFENRIIADYETDPNKIIYGNLDGFAESKGVSLNIDIAFTNGLKILAGTTIMDVSFQENGVKQQQILTERVSGVWSIGYTFKSIRLSIDYTGNLYGPMKLPLLGDLDNRLAVSPWWSIQNIQLTKKIKEQWEIYGGVKNLLNYTPPVNSIARAFDPFDKQVTFDLNGQAIATSNNPNALTFDPSYVFAPNQGVRAFIGVRYTIK
jgi:outer membrane receptor for ferrienterochelin and colicins